MGRQAREASGGQVDLGRQPIYQELHPFADTTPTPTGQPVSQVGNSSLLKRQGIDPSDLIQRRSQGDWADLAPEDWRANDLALDVGSFLLSAYRVGTERVWIVTNPQRSETVLLLPAEY